LLDFSEQHRPDTVMQQIADWLENLGLGQAGYSRGEGQKLVSKAYKNNWNAIYAKRKKKKR
jgi:hypothetical protein